MVSGLGDTSEDAYFCELLDTLLFYLAESFLLRIDELLLTV